MFTATLFTIAKAWQQSVFPSTAEWIEYEVWMYTHTHTHIHTMEHHSVIRKEWYLAICSNMDALGGYIMLSKIRQTEKDKHCMISLIYGIQKTEN